MRVEVGQYQSSKPFRADAGAVETLLTDYRNRIDVRPAAEGQITVVGTNYVGVVHAGDVEVVVTPKVGTLSALWMLGYADRLAHFEGAYDVDTEAGLVDLMARLFARRTRTLIMRGIYRAYVEEETALPFVRGRILPLEDIRRQLGRRDRITCRYADLTADIPFNQVLAYVTRALLRVPIRLAGVRELLAWNLAHLADVTPVRPSGRVLDVLSYNRLNRRYEPVHRLARLILNCLTIRHAPGVEEVPAFLVDMDKVYEEFLRVVFAEAGRPHGYRLRRKQASLDRAGLVPVDPDIVLVDSTRRAAAVLDAKYKRTDPQADVYQGLAYAKAFGMRRVALVYPEDGEVIPITHQIRHDDVVVLVRTIPVSRGVGKFSGLEERVRVRASAVLRELRDPLRAAA